MPLNWVGQRQPNILKSGFIIHAQTCIEKCVIQNCLSNLWLYNLEAHFIEKHGEVDYPIEKLVTEEEKKFILSL